MNKLVKLLLLLGITATLTSGCAVNRATANVDPTTNLSALKTMYVKKHPDDNGGTNLLIADKLREKGVTVITGETQPTTKVDAVVTYVEKWMWDITMYMLSLSVVVRDPQSEFPLATGNSYHTSLTRLSPKEMVNEVVDNIYKGQAK